MSKLPNWPVTIGDITFRPMSKADIHDRYLETLNCPEHMRFSQQRFAKHTQQSCEAYIEAKQQSDDYFLASLVNDIHIGNVGLDRNVRHQIINISILLFKDSVGKGFGNKVFQAAVNFAWQMPDARKLEIGTLVNNHAMIALAKNAGFKPDGCRKGQFLSEGEAHDICYFSAFKDINK